MWIKTFHVFDDNTPELINIDTGVCIRVFQKNSDDPSSQWGVWINPQYVPREDRVITCLFLGTEAECIKVFDKLSRSLGVHNEISPDKAF